MLCLMIHRPRTFLWWVSYMRDAVSVWNIKHGWTLIKYIGPMLLVSDKPDSSNNTLSFRNIKFEINNWLVQINRTELNPWCCLVGGSFYWPPLSHWSLPNIVIFYRFTQDMDFLVHTVHICHPYKEHTELNRAHSVWLVKRLYLSHKWWEYFSKAISKPCYVCCDAPLLVVTIFLVCNWQHYGDLFRLQWL